MASTQLTIDDVPITLQDTGSGRPALVLHGGGGPETVLPIAEHLGATMRALTPIHPGWNGTERPDRVASVGELAAIYLDLLAAEGLRDVVVVGSSIGGWIALEMAVRDDRALGALVLIDSMGIAVDGEPITDVYSLSARELVDDSFHDGDRFYVDPATVPADQARAQATNMETMRVVAGDPYMHDPGLRPKLASVTCATDVIWGTDDRIVTPDYGRALAASIGGGARFELVHEAGHLPQLERPEATFALIDGFLSER